MSARTNVARPLAAVQEASVRLRLDALEVGQRAVLEAPEGEDPTVVRLAEMGLTRGTEVQLVRRAPFGDPLEVQVRGTRLCLRRADARRFPARVVGIGP